MGMIIAPHVNENGIPALRSTAVTVTDSNVQFAFNNHRNIGTPFRGLLIVDLAQAIPDGTTDTLPIVFTSLSASDKTLQTYNGDDITVADIAGTGIYLVWYDSYTGLLQLLS